MLTEVLFDQLQPILNRVQRMRYEPAGYFTVTDFAKLRGMSGFKPRSKAM
jgi:hypothetical protein